MKFLHTADWHLGVKSMGKDRIECQKRTMQEICSIADEQNIDVVIIAGDVYNSSVPTALSEELFYETVEKLSNNGNRIVLVVSGNHDDPERLCAGLPLAFKHNIVLAGDISPLNIDKFVKGKDIEVTLAKEGFVKIKKGEEIVNIAYLPFDSTLKARPNVQEKSYSSLVGEIAKEISQDFNENEFNILVSHLFLVGSRIARDRVVNVGDVFAVSKHDLPNADYIALGHIHSNQVISDNAFYSGATSKLRPQNGDLFVNVFESNKNNINLQTIKLETPERYEQIKVHSLLEAEEKLREFKNSDLVEITFVLKEPLKASEIKELKNNYECVISVNLELINDQKEPISYNNFTRKNLSEKELFKAFYLKKKGVEPRESLLDLFLECKGGRNETN